MRPPTLRGMMMLLALSLAATPRAVFALRAGLENDTPADVIHAFAPAAGLEDNPQAIHALIETVFPNGRFEQVGDRIIGPYRLTVRFVNEAAPAGNPRQVRGWVELTKSSQAFTAAEITAARQWTFGLDDMRFSPHETSAALTAPVGVMPYAAFLALTARRASSFAILPLRTEPVPVTWLDVQAFQQHHEAWVAPTMAALNARARPIIAATLAATFQEVGLVDTTDPVQRTLHLYVDGDAALESVVARLLGIFLMPRGFAVEVHPLPAFAPVRFPGVVLTQKKHRDGFPDSMAVFELPGATAAEAEPFIRAELDLDRVVAAAYWPAFAENSSLRPVVVTIQTDDGRRLTTIWV